MVAAESRKLGSQSGVRCTLPAPPPTIPDDDDEPTLLHRRTPRLAAVIRKLPPPKPARPPEPAFVAERDILKLAVAFATVTRVPHAPRPAAPPPLPCSPRLVAPVTEPTPARAPSPSPPPSRALVVFLVSFFAFVAALLALALFVYPDAITLLVG